MMSLENTLTVDVVIPAYNAELYIERTVRSVLAQTYPLNRIVIVNDGSSDRTVSLLEKIKAEGGVASKIEIYSKKNGGHASAVNKGIELATADLIALLDADDEWLPEKIEKQVAVLNSSLELGLVYTDYEVIDEYDKINQTETEKRIRPQLTGQVFEKLILDGNLISGSNSGVLIRSDLLKQNPFDEVLIACEDWDLWIRLSEFTSVAFVPEVLVKIRRHSRNQSSNQLLMLKYDLMVLHKHLAKIGYFSQKKALFRSLSQLGLKSIFFNFLEIERIVSLCNVNRFDFVLLYFFVLIPYKLFEKTLRFL